MEQEILQQILTSIATLNVDVSYIKKNLDTLKSMCVRVALLEDRVDLMRKINWTIFSTVLVAIVSGVLAIII